MGSRKQATRLTRPDAGPGSSRTPARTGKPRSPKDSAADSRALVQQLLEQCGQCEAQESEYAEGEHTILIDVEHEGLRCVVSRERRRVDSARIELTPREQEVARMVAKGYPNKSIAAVLDISRWTVGTYLRRVFAKLNVNSRAAMVSRLLEEHILDHK